MYDYTIIGAGHNGLVCAAYLAQTGKRVLVLEKRAVLGGACTTEPIFKNCKVSRAAYVLSLFHPQIIADLDLKNHQLKLLKRDPSSISLFNDNNALILGSDLSKNIRSISKFSSKDAKNYPLYLAYLDSIVDFIDKTLTLTPPNIIPRSFSDIKSMILLFTHVIFHFKSALSFLYLLTKSAEDILDKWFESDQLKGVLATDGIIGAMASPKTKGTAYILLHHVMGKVTNQTGVWAYVEGGMGGLIDALYSVCIKRHVTIKTSANVSSIDSSNPIKKIYLENGSFIESHIVISNADPFVTSTLLDPKQLSKSYLNKINRIDFSSPVVKINVHLSALPNFTSSSRSLRKDELQGTIHINPSITDLDSSYNQALKGSFSTLPLIEITIPTTLDKTLAPKGEHVMGIFTQYAPLNHDKHDWEEEKNSYVERVFNLIQLHCPNFKSLILDYEALCPRDLARIFSLTDGNIFHGAMTFKQLFSFRPINGYADYTTAIKGVYLCGSGTHPGGGVTGIPGWNAAQKIIKDTIS